jgi:hypothetical protein
MQNCITRRLGFSPTQKALRIEASCDRLRLLGTCKNFKSSKAAKSSRKQTPSARSSSRVS